LIVYLPLVLVLYIRSPYNISLSNWICSNYNLSYSLFSCQSDIEETGTVVAQSVRTNRSISDMEAITVLIISLLFMNTISLPD